MWEKRKEISSPDPPARRQAEPAGGCAKRQQERGCRQSVWSWVNLSPLCHYRNPASREPYSNTHRIPPHSHLTPTAPSHHLAHPAHIISFPTATKMDDYMDLPWYTRLGGAYALSLQALLFLWITFFYFPNDVQPPRVYAPPLHLGERYAKLVASENQNRVDKELLHAINILKVDSVAQLCKDRTRRPFPGEYVHTALAQQFQRISDPQQQRGLHLFKTANQVVEILVDHCGDDTAAWRNCPINDALHYRTFFAGSAQLLLKRMSAEEKEKCWSRVNKYGDLTLHHISKSQAAGFARYFLGLQIRGNTSGALHDILRLRSPSIDARVDYRAVDDAVSADDLIAVLKIGREVMHPGKFQQWIEQRDGLGRTPLMLACASGSEGRVKALLEAGARPFVYTPFLELSALWGRGKKGKRFAKSGLWKQNAIHELAARGQDKVFDVVVQVAGIDAVFPA